MTIEEIFAIPCSIFKDSSIRSRILSIFWGSSGGPLGVLQHLLKKAGMPKNKIISKEV